MIDERFSASSFASCQLDSQAARELADSLAEEIQAEMHRVVFGHFSKIIENLNAMGHSLRPEFEAVPGDISYRDDWKDESGYHCKLRVALNTVVSTGYAHLSNEDEVLKV